MISQLPWMKKVGSCPPELSYAAIWIRQITGTFLTTISPSVGTQTIFALHLHPARASSIPLYELRFSSKLRFQRASSVLPPFSSTPLVFGGKKRDIRNKGAIKFLILFLDELMLGGGQEMGPLVVSEEGRWKRKFY